MNTRDPRTLKKYYGQANRMLMLFIGNTGALRGDVADDVIEQGMRALAALNRRFQEHRRAEAVAAARRESAQGIAKITMFQGRPSARPEADADFQTRESFGIGRRLPTGDMA